MWWMGDCEGQTARDNMRIKGVKNELWIEKQTVDSRAATHKLLHNLPTNLVLHHSEVDK